MQRADVSRGARHMHAPAPPHTAVWPGERRHRTRRLRQAPPGWSDPLGSAPVPPAGSGRAIGGLAYRDTPRLTAPALPSGRSVSPGLVLRRRRDCAAAADIFQTGGNLEGHGALRRFNFGPRSRCGPPSKTSVALRGSALPLWEERGKDGRLQHALALRYAGWVASSAWPIRRESACCIVASAVKILINAS